MTVGKKMWGVLGLSAVGAFLFWITGWDYTFQYIVAAHDTPQINTFWRNVSLLGLGETQLLLCALVFYGYYWHYSHTTASFKRLSPLYLFWLALLTYLRFLKGTFRYPAVLMSWPRHLKLWFMTMPVMLFAGTLCLLLKVAVGRPRPKMMLWHDGETALQLFGGFLGRYQSFPSGHTLTTFAILAVVWPLYPRARWPLLALAVFSSSARVFSMTTHYVSDVLAGAVLGCLIAIVVMKQLEKNKGVVCCGAS